jgi:hypothetical protein
MRLILILVLLPVCVLAQKARNYSDVTEDLCRRVIAAPRQQIRLAVVPFTATPSSEKSSPAFGEYLTESVIGCLTGNEKIKLFERTRLDAILKEHEFILTDLMKPSAALKVGQLAPIDALLSGTFTVLKSYIDVSARLIDISTGEITVSFNERIRVTRNLSAVVDGTSTTAEETTNKGGATVVMSFSGDKSQPEKSKAEICKKKVEEFSTRLHDLSSNEKIESVVSEATKTPFDNHCGQLHYHVMNSFARYKIDHAGYKNFLLKTIDTIAFPAGDERATEIVRFFAVDNAIDDKEWSSGLTAMARVGNYSLSTYVGNLIGRPTSPTEAITHARIDTFLGLAAANKVGLPRPISAEMAFFEVMEGIKSNQPLRQYTYDKYARTLSLDDKSSSTMFSTLHGMYKDETAPEKKTLIIDWIAEFFNNHNYSKGHEQLYDFAYEFDLTSNESRNEEIRRTNPAGDLEKLVRLCKGKFTEYATVSPYESQTESRVDFCVIHDVPVPGVIPTMEEAAVILKGNNFDQQLRTAQLLSLMGEKPKSIESVLVDVLFKKSLEDRQKLSDVQVQVIVVLGNIRSANPKAIGYMISTLPHYGNDTEASEAALVRIGKPAVRPVVARLEKTTELEGGLQFQLITILGKIGKDAAEGMKAIQKVMNTSRNNDVKYAAEAALQAIGN